MKEQMLNIIRSACQDSDKFRSLENIYSLYEQLQLAENIHEMFDMLYQWFVERYQVKNINFYLFNIQENKQTPMLKVGDEFALDEERSFFFIINTHTQLNAIVSFNASTEEDYNLIMDDYSFIEASLFQISPILQTGIMKKQYIESASIDIVTNVHNKNFLIDYINKKQQLSHHENENIVFLMIGIDRFKAVIDEFDYEIGDQVLVELAKVIHNNINEHDIVSRLDGDEFVVALSNVNSIFNAQSIVENIISQFANAKVLVSNETSTQFLQKTVCIGVSSFPEDSDDINQVLKNADSCLYEAKNIGRGQYFIYKPEELNSIDLF